MGKRTTQDAGVEELVSQFRKPVETLNHLRPQVVEDIAPIDTTPP